MNLSLIEIETLLTLLFLFKYVGNVLSNFHVVNKLWVNKVISCSGFIQLLRLEHELINVSLTWYFDNVIPQIHDQKYIIANGVELLCFSG